MFPVHLTSRAKKVIDLYAQEEAKRLNHDMVTPEHILLGILHDSDALALRCMAIAVGSTPHEQRGRGTPIKAAFTTDFHPG